MEGTFGESSDSLWKLEKSPLSSWLIVEFNPALSSSSTWKQPLNSKHGGVCTIWHRISILLVDCVYARALELGGSSFSRTFRYLLSSDSATPWNRSRAARAIVRTRSDERRKQRREKQGRPVENSKSSLTRLPVDGKLNQTRLDKETRICGDRGTNRMHIGTYIPLCLVRKLISCADFRFHCFNASCCFDVTSMYNFHNFPSNESVFFWSEAKQDDLY